MKKPFPKLPSYEFNWRSIQVEPIPFSGERITLATLVKGGDQAFIAAKLIHSEKIKKIYGNDFGASISDALSLVLRSAEEFYLHKPLSTNWTPPLEGFFTGQLNSSLSQNIEDALFVAAMHSSSFSAAVEAAKDEESNKPGKSAPEIWRKNILSAVKNYRADFANYFDKKIEIRGSGVPLTYSFISASYAAQFDAVSDVSRLQQSLVRAQSKLWQLDRLRDEGTLFKLDLCELLIKPPFLKNDLDKKSFAEFIDELRYEASRRELGIFAADSPHEAANHLISRAA